MKRLPALACMMILCLAPIAAQNDTTEEEQDIQVFNADMIQEVFS